MAEKRPDYHYRAPGRTVARALRLSRLALAAERAARAFWPAWTVLLLAVSAGLFGLFARLDPGIHRYAALAALALFIGTLAWGGLRFRMPTRAEAAQRLDAGDPAHPLETLGDLLAAGADDPRTRQIWFEHRRRAELAAERLRVRPPEPGLPRHDPMALRLFALALLLGGLIGAGGDWAGQLGTLFAPAPRPAPAGAVAVERTPMAEAWAVPPAYTRLDTVFLNRLAEAGQPIELPVGSELVLRVTDVDGVATLDAPGLTGFEGFQSFGGSLAEARALVSQSGHVTVGAGGTVLADWDVTVIPDAPPAIALAAPPDATLAGALRIQFEARDDYGVDAAWAEIVPVGGLEPGRGLDLDPITFGLPLPLTGRALEVKDEAVRDLAEHPWAGTWVELTLHAEDGAHQRATAGPVRLRLPGRFFSDPLARALVEQRGEIAVDFGKALRALDVLQAVTKRPEQVFGDKVGAFLGTRSAVRRLATGIGTETVPQAAPDVVELLWLAALSLEGGDLSSAQERLRAAEEALRRALESGTDEDIRRAMDELRMAMQEYLQEMMRQAMEQGMDPAQQNPSQQGQMLSRQDLEDMLDQMQRLAENGLRDQAREMLSQLSRMMEQLRAGRPQQQQGGPGQQALGELQDMIRRQRDLADETFDALRQQRRENDRSGRQDRGRGGQEPGQQGQQGQGERPGDGQSPGLEGRFGDLAGQQEALRRALEELAGKVPGGDEIRRALEEAGRAMGGARDDLENRSPGEAVEDQMEALDRLAEGAQSLAEQVQNGQGQVGAESEARGEGRADDRRLDPFDRPAASYGAIDGRDTRVPDRSVLDRAREVLEELRRRAGDSGRPQLELDYIDRLMDQF